jgi:septal ring factor EnvC (AmiA/AmiB activator)
VEASSDAPEERHLHRLLIALAVASFLVNTVLVGGIVVLSASGSAREWTADQLDVVRETELRATAEEARNATLTARMAASQGDLGAVQAATSDLELRLTAAEANVAELRADLDAACDWARLQQTNLAASDLVNVFYDYAQSVCLD